MCVHSEPFHLCSKLEIVKVYQILTMVHTCSSAFGVGLDTVVPNIRTYRDVTHGTDIAVNILELYKD